MSWRATPPFDGKQLSLMGAKRSLMHLSLWILLIMAKIEIFHRKRPP